MAWVNPARIKLSNITKVGARYYNALLGNLRAAGGNAAHVITTANFDNNVGGVWLDSASHGDNFHNSIANIDNRIPFVLTTGTIQGDTLAHGGAVPFSFSYADFIKITEYLYYINMNLFFHTVLEDEDGDVLGALDGDYDYIIYRKHFTYPSTPASSEGQWQNWDAIFRPPQDWGLEIPEGDSPLYLSFVSINGAQETQTINRVADETTDRNVEINEIQFRRLDQILPVGEKGFTFQQIRGLVDEIRIYGHQRDNEFLDTVFPGSTIKILVGNYFIDWLIIDITTVGEGEELRYYFNVFLRNAFPLTEFNNTRLVGLIPIEISIPKIDFNTQNTVITYSKPYRVSSISDNTRIFAIPGNRPSATRAFTVFSSAGLKYRITIDSNGNVRLNNNNLAGYADDLFFTDHVSINDFVWMR